MFITKECDYGIRIIRALADGKKKSVKDICLVERVPHQYGYKILKKLEKGHLVASYRGVNGGYALRKSLDEITLYDIFISIEKEINIINCMKAESNCIHNAPGKLCKIHEELCRIQCSLFKQLKEKSMAEIVGD
jgi:Rrf2 family protein